MKTPDDREMEQMLQRILKGKDKPKYTGRMSEEDWNFARGLLEQVDSGSKGVFVVLNDDNSVDYMMANVSRLEAIEIMARFMQRTARHIEREGND